MKFVRRLNFIKSFHEKNRQFHTLKADGICPQCRTVGIEPATKKCPQCQSFLDLRRYLNLSNTFLAIVLAVVTVSSLLLPAIDNYFSVPASNMTAQLVDVRKKDADGPYGFEIQFLCNNNGDYPAWVQWLNVKIKLGDEFESTMRLLSEEDNRVVNPNELRSFLVSPKMTLSVSGDDSGYKPNPELYEIFDRWYLSRLKNLDLEKSILIEVSIQMYYMDYKGEEKWMQVKFEGNLIQFLDETLQSRLDEVAIAEL